MLDYVCYNALRYTSVEHFVSSHTDSRLHKYSRILYRLYKVGGHWGKSQTNLPKARQRLEMRDSLCCATLVAAHACSKHVLEPLRASAER